MTRAVFLDRDGVINANLERAGQPVAPTRIEEFRILPGVKDAVHALKAAKFHLVVITNQPDVATGRTPKSTVERMHDEIRRSMPIDDIKACFHVDQDNCNCRKPKPGMILEAAAEHGIDLKRSYVVGDRWKDVAAGRAAGCLTIFVDYGYEQSEAAQPDKVVGSLAEAAAYIIDREQSGD